MPHPPLRVVSSMATRAVLAELLDRHAAGAEPRPHLESVGGVDAARRVRAGEAFDVVVLAAKVIDELLAEGRLAAGSRVDLVRSGIAVAVRAGAPRPDIGTEEALRRAVLAAASVAYSTGPSGQHLLRLFEHWGIAETLAPRIVQAPPGVPVGSLVARGEVELCFQQLSELIGLPGIDVLGPLPESVQSITVFSGGVGRDAERPDDARALLAFLAAPAAAEVKRRHGMEPA